MRGHAKPSKHLAAALVKLTRLVRRGCVSVPGSKSCDIKTLADVVQSGKKRREASGGISAMMTLTFPITAL